MQEFNSWNKIIIFKILALSSITFLDQVSVVPNQIIYVLQQIQHDFLWNSSLAKLKHNTISKNVQYGGLNNVDIESKIISSQCSWVNKVYHESFHEWKIIPLILVKYTFGEWFIFYSKLDFNVFLKLFPDFYINTFIHGKTLLLSLTYSKFLRFSKAIQIDNKPFHFQDFSKEIISCVEYLWKSSGVFKSCIEIKAEYNLEKKNVL